MGEEECKEGDAGRQQDEGEADAIDSDEILRSEGRDPGRLLDPLEAAGGIEVGKQGEGKSEFCCCDGGSDQAGDGGGEKKYEEETDKRPGQEGREGMVHGVTTQCSWPGGAGYCLRRA